MGLFSKLFGGKSNEDSNDKDVMKITNPNTGEVIKIGPARNPASQYDSGDSWGPTMPDEPNQYNSGRPYHDYFSRVFAEAFPAYQIDKKMNIGERGYVYTFTQDGATKLVVEVISAKSSVYKLRRDCRKQGIPYIRFYHDYHGWWNTKSYVIRRAKEALGI